MPTVSACVVALPPGPGVPGSQTAGDMYNRVLTPSSATGGGVGVAVCDAGGEFGGVVVGVWLGSPGVNVTDGVGVGDIPGNGGGGI